MQGSGTNFLIFIIIAVIFLLLVIAAVVIVKKFVFKDRRKAEAQPDKAPEKQVEMVSDNEIASSRMQ